MEETLENLVQIQNIFHHFRAFTELNGRDSKGGYIQAKISVPSNAAKILISISTLTKTPHVNWLFVSPKKRIGKPSNILPQDHKVILFKNPNGEFEIRPPNYWGNLTSAQILGSDFWNGQELVLGSNALQLTVCKAKQKGSDSEIEDFDGEMEKVRLKVEFELEQKVQVEYLEYLHSCPPVEESPSLVSYSSVIFDKQKYCLEIDEIFNGRKVCNHGEHVLVINFQKVKITQDKSLRLLLCTKLNQFYQEEFDKFEVKNPNVVKFKISAQKFPIQESQEGILFAFISDPDLRYTICEDLEKVKECQKLSILQHDENCPICASGHTQLPFNSKSPRKRKNSAMSNASKRSKESTTSDDAADSPQILENHDLLSSDGYEISPQKPSYLWRFFKFLGFFALLPIYFW